MTIYIIHISPQSESSPNDHQLLNGEIKYGISIQWTSMQLERGAKA